MQDSRLQQPLLLLACLLRGCRSLVPSFAVQVMRIMMLILLMLRGSLTNPGPCSELLPGLRKEGSCPRSQGMVEAPRGGASGSQ